MITRRQILKTSLLAGAAVLAAPASKARAQAKPGATPDAGTGPFKLPPLPYSFDALEPHIDAKTMEIHHDKHHAGYVKKLNDAVAQQPDLGSQPIEDILKKLSAVKPDIAKAVRNNGGGHYNHSLFWQMMKPKGGGEPKGDLAKAIAAKWGTFADFKKTFSKEAADVFGSGWAWLCLAGKDLEIDSTPNQDNPISQGKLPLLGIDVWEHAYYLKRQNKRPEYIEAFWNVVNWDFVEDRFKKKA
jgi:Fe-Mn family superoxide dismutase